MTWNQIETGSKKRALTLENHPHYELITAVVICIKLAKTIGGSRVYIKAGKRQEVSGVVGQKRRQCG